MTFYDLLSKLERTIDRLNGLVGQQQAVVVPPAAAAAGPPPGTTGSTQAGPPAPGTPPWKIPMLPQKGRQAVPVSQPPEAIPQPQSASEPFPAPSGFSPPMTAKEMKRSKRWYQSRPPDLFGATSGLLGASSGVIPFAGDLAIGMNRVRGMSQAWDHFKRSMWAHRNPRVKKAKLVTPPTARFPPPPPLPKPTTKLAQPGQGRGAWRKRTQLAAPTSSGGPRKKTQLNQPTTKTVIPKPFHVTRLDRWSSNSARKDKKTQLDATAQQQQQGGQQSPLPPPPPPAYSAKRSSGLGRPPDDGHSKIDLDEWKRTGEEMMDHPTVPKPETTATARIKPRPLAGPTRLRQAPDDVDYDDRPPARRTRTGMGAPLKTMLAGDGGQTDDEAKRSAASGTNPLDDTADNIRNLVEGQNKTNELLEKMTVQQTQTNKTVESRSVSGGPGLGDPEGSRKVSGEGGQPPSVGKGNGDVGSVVLKAVAGMG